MAYRNKKLDEKWKVCSFCKYIKRCETGQGRIIDLADNPVAYNDIGCFDYEVYKKQFTGKQLGLFN